MKKVKSLLIPLYLWNFFYGIVQLVLRSIGFTIGEEVNIYNLLIAPINDGHQFSFNMGGWFIIPLFMVQIYNILLRRLLGRWIKEEWIYFIINLILGASGVYIASIGFHTGWWLVITRMLYFLPFYSLGILYKNKLERWDKKVSNLWYFSVLFIMQGMIIFVNGKASSFLPSWCNNFDGNLFLPFIVGCTGIAFWFRIAANLEPILGKSKLVNIVADNSYSIMINQFMGAMVVKTCFALIARYTSFCADFNMALYKDTIWYEYYPEGFPQIKVLYVIMGFLVPIIMQQIVNWGNKIVKKKFSCYNVFNKI